MILTRLLGGGEPDREADGEGGVGPPAQRGHRHQARAGQQLVLVTPVHALYSTVQYSTVHTLRKHSLRKDIVNVYLRSLDTLNNAGEVQKTFLPHEELLIPLNLCE